MIEWRRVELHKIFAEELEEATRMGEMESSTAKRLQHEYFDCQVREFVFVFFISEILYMCQMLHEDILFSSPGSSRGSPGRGPCQSALCVI